MGDNYLAEEFDSLLKFIEEIDEILKITIRGIINLKGIEEVSVYFKRPAEQIEEARLAESLAKKERDSGFPTLTAHSVVSLWAALEATIPRFCVDLLLRYPALLENPTLGKLRLPVIAHLSRDRRQFMERVVEELERGSNASLKSGVGRFELVLDAVGLGGGIDDDLRRTLFELNKVRNVIVHNFSRVDSEIVASCPWRNEKLGEKVRISIDDYGRYRNSVLTYASSILNRLTASGMADVSKNKDQSRTE